MEQIEYDSIAKDAAKRMLQARNNLILGHPFFGALSMNLAFVPKAKGIDLAATDGKSLFYNPVEIMKLTFSQTVTTIVHEVMHCALGHHVRRGNRNPKRWNRAVDYAENPLILDARFEPIPGWLLRDDYRGLSGEVIFTRETEADQNRTQEEKDELDEKAEKLGKVEDPSPGEGEEEGEEGDSTGEGNGKPTNGKPSSSGTPTPLTQSEMAERQSSWETKVMQAYAVAKAAGQLPGAAQYIVDKIQKSKLDWKTILADFAQTCCHDETTWARCNRRFLSQGIYLPGRTGNKMSTMVVVIDWSGSIFGSPRCLDAFNDQMNSIIEDCAPETTHVLGWDTICQSHDEYGEDDLPIKVTAKGGGGTDFSGIWGYLEEQGIEPDCLVCLTDLYCSFGNEPSYPILWCSIGDDKAPFGEVVSLTLDS